MPIAIAIITQDNQDIIKDCLESAKWADEIIVVDAFSRDKTVEIAKGYTDKIYQHQIARNLNEQWNRAIGYSTADWIFVLSSDQIITPELQNEIKEVIRRKDAKAGYYVPMENYFLGKWIRHCGWYPDYNVRLFKRGQAVFEDREHGLLIVDGDCAYLNNRLIHYAHKDISTCMRKLNMYSAREAEYFLQTKATFKKRFLFTKPWRNFRKTYWKKKGYKDGMHGLVFCMTFAFYRFLIFAKYWELLQKRDTYAN